MPEIHVSRRLDSPAADVWARIGDFYALHDWHPTIVNVHPGPERGIRAVTTADGREVDERLVEQGSSWYTYEPADPNVGAPGYRATLRVREEGPDACTVEWSGSFDGDGASAEAHVTRIGGFYRRGVDGL